MGRKMVTYESLLSMYVRCCSIAGRRGWNERSAGGLSVRLDAEDVMQMENGLSFRRDFLPLLAPVKDLAKDFILISGCNAHLEDIANRPEDLCGVVQISPDGAGYRIVKGFGTKGGISSDSHELAGMEPNEDLYVHLSIHEMEKKKKGPYRSVVYHGHPTNLVALTYLLPLEERSFSDTLRRSSLNLRKNLKRDLGMVDRLIMDEKELTQITLEKLRQSDAVVWAFHGICLPGDDMMDVIAFVDALDKAAEVRLKILQASGGALQEPVISTAV